jgi:hypothetical protein
MPGRPLVVVACVLAGGIGLAGCSEGAPPPADAIPVELTQERVEELEALATSLPRAVAFPDQAALAPVKVVVDGLLEQGAGITSVELTGDDSVLEVNPEYITFDLTEYVPEGQPVEVNMALKWYGNPGAGVDMDIYANVPGTHDAYDPEAWNWDFNWNIVNKARTVDTVHIAGEPLEVGMQVTNGKALHPEGVRWQFRFELYFPANVLPPGIPFAIHVPPEGRGLIFESEPVTGEEHVTSSFIVVGPDDQFVRAVRHNDIGTETLFIPVRGAGEYVVYSQAQHGGFLRVETDVPSGQNVARALARTVTEAVLVSQLGMAPGAAGTPVDMAMRGDIDTSTVPSPLDLAMFARPAAGAALTGSVVAEAASAAGIVDQLSVTVNAEGDFGRIGNRWTDNPDAQAMGRQNLDGGAYTYAITANGAVGLDIGYRIVSYVR